MSTSVIRWESLAGETGAELCKRPIRYPWKFEVDCRHDHFAKAGQRNVEWSRKLREARTRIIEKSKKGRQPESGSVWNERSSLIEAAVKKDDATINVTPELPLIRLLDMVRSKGAIRLAHGEDVFVVTRETPRLPETARDFLKSGGVVDPD